MKRNIIILIFLIFPLYPLFSLEVGYRNQINITSGGAFATMDKAIDSESVTRTSFRVSADISPLGISLGKNFSILLPVIGAAYTTVSNVVGRTYLDQHFNVYAGGRLDYIVFKGISIFLDGFLGLEYYPHQRAGTKFLKADLGLKCQIVKMNYIGIQVGMLASAGKREFTLDALYSFML